MILTGDIGGTHARFALSEPGMAEPVAERWYASTTGEGLAPLLADFLERHPARMDIACLAVAGPIADDGRHARLTNLPWAIDAFALERHFAIPRVLLANDFTAAAHGIATCPATALTVVQPGEPLARAPRLVVGAGTGLGMAILLPRGRSWYAVPGEGGHIGFGPTDPEQAALWQSLYQRHGRVTAERVVSGPGLEAIHRFLATGTDPLPAAAVADRAAAGDAIAQRALDIFFRAYGAFAGDMAMAVLARGGVYLAGGIAAKLRAQLLASDFRTAFNAKAEHAQLVGRIPVTIVADPALGLRGAAAIAIENLASHSSP